MKTADIGPFVPRESQPSEIVDDRPLGLARRSLGVGVLDPKDERSALALRPQPVEQSRPGIAHVQLSCWTGSKPQPQPGHLAISRRSTATACAAIASPRPTASTPSLVLPLTPTAPSSHPSTRASCAQMRSRNGAIFGRSRITVASTLATDHPAWCAIATDRP